MKTSTNLLFSFVLLTCSFANAGALNDKYLEAMRKNIEKVYAAESLEALQESVNAFDRIAEAEKTKWEPYYYSAFGSIMMANRESDGARKDVYLDQAMASIKKAAAINAKESEIVALEGFVHMIRVSVDPATRGQQYSGLSMQAFSKAVALNPENPRALSLLAQMQYGTAQFFGSSTAEACQTLEKSLQKFESYKPESPIAPQWGKSMAEGLKQRCQ